MANENEVYEFLTNAATAEKVVDSVKVDNFWVKEFLTDNAVINSSTAEYYSSNPAIGTKYKKTKGNTKMTWAEDKVYKCSLPALIDKIFQARITKDMLRIATGSSEKAEMIAALQANNLRKQLDIEIMEKCVEVVCKKENFSDDSWIEMEAGDFADGAKFLEKLFGISERMKHPNNSYNKGFKKSDGSFENTVYASGSLKRMVIVLDTDHKTKLRMEGSKTYHYNLVDLEQEFKAVYDAPLPTINNKKVGGLIMDEESFALNWQIAPQIIVQDDSIDPLTKKASLPGFVVGGPISFANMAIIVGKPIVPSSSSSSSRTTPPE